MVGFGWISFHSPVEIYFLLATQNCKGSSISHMVTSKYLHYTYLLCVCELSEDSLQELALSSHPGRPRDGTQIVRLGGKCLYQLSHLSGHSHVVTLFLAATHRGW